MKRLLVLFLFCSVAFTLIGCTPSDVVIVSLPAYQDMAMYTEGDFQDYTDFAIYTYADLDEAVLKSNSYFHKITTEDMQNILAYIDNFEQWIDVFRSGSDASELAAHYSFDKSIIDEKDYICIETNAKSSTYERFDNYSVYFFDTDTCTLYYFHNNI